MTIFEPPLPVPQLCASGSGLLAAADTSEEQVQPFPGEGGSRPQVLGFPRTGLCHSTKQVPGHGVGSQILI